MSIINQSNIDKFEAVFSNIPVPATRTDKFDIRLIDNFIRNVTLPDYNVEVVFSDLMNTQTNNPISRFNNDNSPVTIEFTVDEDMENYLAFFEWITQLRLGNPCKGESTTRNSTIKTLYVIMKDNEDRKGAKIVLTDLLIISLSSLNLAFGNSEQSTFNVTLNFKTFDIERGTLTLNN
jgi:hypothetical protein